MIAVYPGSFDPVTYGHIDIIERAARLADELVVLIMQNDQKKGLFTYEERKDMLEKATSYIPNVRIEIGNGLTVEVAKEIGASMMIRGIRAVSDYEYELQLATTNLTIEPELETVFLIAKPEYSFLSSSTTKTLAQYGGDIGIFVPEYVAEKLKEKYKK